MERFPNARAFDCFDNDLAGRIYGLRMMALQEDIQMKISRTDGGIRIEAKGKVFERHGASPTGPGCQAAEHPVPYGTVASSKGFQGLERLSAEQADGAGDFTTQRGT